MEIKIQNGDAEFVIEDVAWTWLRWDEVVWVVISGHRGTEDQSFEATCKATK